MTRRRPASGDSGARILQFVYDLSVSPLTFDFASFLAAAEVERRLRGLDSIDVVFVPGPNDGAREETPDYEAAIDVQARTWRLRHMLIPMLSFVPSVRSFTVCRDRDQANTIVTDDPSRLYPNDYRLFLPRAPDKKVIHEHARAGAPVFPMFRAPEQARRLTRQFLDTHAKGRRPIVITLRNYPYTPQRNSRNEDWLAFADGLDRARYAAIFVNDSETVTGLPPCDFSRHLVFDLASVNLELRLALYEAAWLNMAVMHGPAELFWYGEHTRYIVFNQVGLSAVQMEESLIRSGQVVGADLDFAKPYQHIVWTADDLDSLRREFAAMEKLLESTGR